MKKSRMFSRLRSMPKGFTVMELAVVTLVISITIAVSHPVYKKYQAKSKTTQGKLDLSALYVGEMNAKSEWGTFVSCLFAIGVPGTAYLPQSVTFPPSTPCTEPVCKEIETHYFTTTINWLEAETGAPGQTWGNPLVRKYYNNNCEAYYGPALPCPTCHTIYGGKWPYGCRTHLAAYSGFWELSTEGAQKFDMNYFPPKFTADTFWAISYAYLSDCPEYNGSFINPAQFMEIWVLNEKKEMFRLKTAQ
jgi:type II secretory pathway pseudopilin PulG